MSSSGTRSGNLRSHSATAIELSMRHRFAYWMATGVIYRGWALSAAGKSAEGILSIEQAIGDLRATGALDLGGYNLALKNKRLANYTRHDIGG
jgi:hypothetical protein